MKRELTAGIIGAGAISDIYLKNLTSVFQNVKVKSISARHIEHAQAKAQQYNIQAVSNEEVFGDPQIDLIVILTPVETHYELIRQALLSGKHVYTEKTICTTTDQANELLELAEEKHLYIGCAPDTFLGPCFQTADDALKNNMIGDVHSFSVSITRNNDLLTALFPFLRTPGAGALRDYLVYYLTALVYLLGPVKQVSAFLRTPYPTRINNVPDTSGSGEMIETPNEAIVTVIAQMENGTVGTIHEDNETVIFDRADFCIYGRDGYLKIGNPNQFDDPVYLYRSVGFTKPEPEELKPVNDLSGNLRGIGIADMCDAILEGRECKASADLAIHVLSIIEAIERSATSGKAELVK